MAKSMPGAISHTSHPIWSRREGPGIGRGPLDEATPHGDEAGRAELVKFRRDSKSLARRFGLPLGWPSDASPDPAQSFFFR